MYIISVCRIRDDKVSHRTLYGNGPDGIAIDWFYVWRTYPHSEL